MKLSRQSPFFWPAVGIVLAEAIVAIALLAVGLWVSPVLAALTAVLLLVAVIIFDYLGAVRARR